VAVADEGNRLGLPLVVGIVDGLLEGGGEGAVVLGGDDHEGVGAATSATNSRICSVARCDSGPGVEVDEIDDREFHLVPLGGPAR
jgi:hypothetical protein